MTYCVRDEEGDRMLADENEKCECNLIGDDGGDVVYCACDQWSAWEHVSDRGRKGRAGRQASEARDFFLPSLHQIYSVMGRFCANLTFKSFPCSRRYTIRSVSSLVHSVRSNEPRTAPQRRIILPHVIYRPTTTLPTLTSLFFSFVVFSL